MHWTTAPTPRPVRIARAAATVLRAEGPPFAECGPRDRQETDPAARGAERPVDAAHAPVDDAGRPSGQRPLAPPVDDTADRGILRLRHADRA